MPLKPFAASEPYTLGVELELQVVSPPGYNLSQESSTLISALENRVNAGEVKHDITESMLEIATSVCRDINQAAAEFAALQREILACAQQHHLIISGGGTHPFQKWQRQEVCASERYARTLELFGYLIKQATVFGQHVHVGCRTGEEAIYLMHGLSRFVPHFVALSASSPYMQGSDTGFASSRLNIFSAFPDNGPAPFAADWTQFEKMYARLEGTRVVQSIKDLHWDIRPSPGFGTVEVRVMDTPLTLERAINIAGFIQALSHWLLDARPYKHKAEDYLIYRFNRFQACRYGLDGMLTDVCTGEQRTIGEDILCLLDTLERYARPLNADSALEAIHRYVKNNDSDVHRIREFTADGGSLSELVRLHGDIWAA
ncbi:YbdK family carboxylate-amine ligase [Cronobacter dublinensis]|uniref:YbdK family carboxylate-amine ligase n=1 Tax=Cronobacter dublinensis TaxID=413497 RepID=UPI0024C4529F|nr:YbdK family carboxylate-amine ligase [Cronobacter dublinensis]MDK1198863.1 YbdK family carboxylate-amine ligase [Cronobacter dublinensis]